ncbi:hypothetical protein Droror1_Dr00004181 [Drosera rotundifolia]
MAILPCPQPSTTPTWPTALMVSSSMRTPLQLAMLAWSCFIVFLCLGLRGGFKAKSAGFRCDIACIGCFVSGLEFHRVGVLHIYDDVLGEDEMSSIRRRVFFGTKFCS